MAVVQISRIQIRRGQKNVTGMPQLAGGEMAWAVDTQELYIGNGSVAEGSPGVGNTKVLTQNDLNAQGNLLNLLQHIYKVNDTSVVTGPSATSPISRTLQDRLDDLVSAADFGAKGDGVTDDTVALQRAINQLFLNSSGKASATSNTGYMARKILVLPAGLYVLSSTLYIPSYATIIGAGSDKSILQNSVAGPAVVFVNDLATAGVLPAFSTTTFNNQPKNIMLKGVTVHTATNNQIGLRLDAVRDSIFEDVTVQGDWASTTTTGSNGIVLNAWSSLVTSERNLFKRVTIKGFTRCVYAGITNPTYTVTDILNNTFEDCYITDCQQGFSLGTGAISGYGPRRTLITNCEFSEIKQQAVYLELGSKNTIRDSKMYKVGNDGGSFSAIKYPEIYFKVNGNSVDNNSSDRTENLANNNYNYPYIPEVAGYLTYTSYGTNKISIGANTSLTNAFRVPVSTTSDGIPAGAISYLIEYMYQSSTNNFTRRGTLSVSADINNAIIQLSDEYDYAGGLDPSGVAATILNFSAKFLDKSGVDYTGAGGQVPYSLAIKYTNQVPGGADSGTLVYSYSSTISRSPT